MRETGDNRLSTILLIIIVLALIYALYIMLGGDWLAITKLSASFGSGGIVEQFTGSLRALGDSLVRMFSSIIR